MMIFLMFALLAFDPFVLGPMLFSVVDLRFLLMVHLLLPTLPDRRVRPFIVRQNFQQTMSFARNKLSALNLL